MSEGARPGVFRPLENEISGVMKAGGVEAAKKHVERARRIEEQNRVGTSAAKGEELAHLSQRRSSRFQNPEFTKSN